MSKNQRWEIGAIVKIPLNNGSFCYGQMLSHEKCEMAIFDSRTNENIEPTRIKDLPVLFRVAVHKSAYNKGRWQKIGKASIQDELLEPRETYIEDKISGKFQIYRLGEIRASNRQECIGLECCAVWEANHVEDRIRDYYAGRQCVWLNDFWR